MGITVKAIMETLDEMRKIYPFEDEHTRFELNKNPLKDKRTVVGIKTIDKATGIEVHLAKDAEWESIKVNY